MGRTETNSAGNRAEGKPVIRYSFYDITECRNRINEMLIVGRIVAAEEPSAGGLPGTSVRETPGHFAPELPGCGMGSSGAFGQIIFKSIGLFVQKTFLPAGSPDWPHWCRNNRTFYQTG